MAYMHMSAGMHLTLKQLCANRLVRECFRDAIFQVKPDSNSNVGVVCEPVKAASITDEKLSLTEPLLLFGFNNYFLPMVSRKTAEFHDQIIATILFNLRLKALILPHELVQLLREEFAQTCNEVLRWTRKHECILAYALKNNVCISASVLRWYPNGTICDWLTAWHIVFGQDWACADDTGHPAEFPEELCFIIASFYCFDDFFVAHSAVSYSSRNKEGEKCHVPGTSDLFYDCINLMKGNVSLEIAQSLFNTASVNGFCTLARRIWSVYPLVWNRDAFSTVTSLFLHAVSQLDHLCIDYILSKLGVGESQLAATVMHYVAAWCTTNCPSLLNRVLSFLTSCISKPDNNCGPCPVFPGMQFHASTYIPPLHVMCGVLGLYTPLMSPVSPYMTTTSTPLCPPPSPCPSPPPSPLLSPITDVPNCAAEVRNSAEANTIVRTLYSTLLRHRNRRLWRGGLLAMRAHSLADLCTLLRYQDYSLMRCACFSQASGNSNSALLVQALLSVSPEMLRRELLSFEHFYVFRCACKHGDVWLLRTLHFFSAPFLWSAALENCDWFRICSATGRVTALAFFSAFCSAQQWKHLCSQQLAHNNYSSSCYVYKADVVHFLAMECLKMDLILDGCF